MATEPGKIFLPNYIILYFFRIQNLEGGADRVDKKWVQACRSPGTPGFMASLDFFKSANPISTRGKIMPPTLLLAPQIFGPSYGPRVDVVWNNAAFWKRYGDLRGKEQKASFVSKTTETTTAAAANSLLCQGIEPIIMPKLCHAMVPVANAANFLTWQEILTD